MRTPSSSSILQRAKRLARLAFDRSAHRASIRGASALVLACTLLGSAACGAQTDAGVSEADSGVDASAAAAGEARVYSDPDLGVTFTELTWSELAELNVESGEPSPLLAGLDGQLVKVPGFMVPLDDGDQFVHEFLLVPYAGACVHVPPPPPNQIVHVEMLDGQEAEVSWWDPKWILGTIHIDDTEHAFGVASYRMEGLRTETFTWDEPMP